jgi:hypothetical protein
MADVVKIPKSGKDSLFPQNSRPISLLPKSLRRPSKVVFKRNLKHYG